LAPIRFADQWPAVNSQLAAAKTIFPIKPFDELVDQFAGKRSFVDEPALDSGKAMHMEHLG
jgi:hypothetical protein